MELGLLVVIAALVSWLIYLNITLCTWRPGEAPIMVELTDSSRQRAGDLLSRLLSTKVQRARTLLESGQEEQAEALIEDCEVLYKAEQIVRGNAWQLS